MTVGEVKDLLSKATSDTEVFVRERDEEGIHQTNYDVLRVSIEQYIDINGELKQHAIISSLSEG